MNLSVTLDNKTLFTHDGHWLHPLFALEDYLLSEKVDPARLFLCDKLIGRGAAVLIYRMGIRRCHGRTVSERGLSFFRENSIECSYDVLVERLDCQTELVLSDEMSSEEAYGELCRRAGRI